MAELKSIGDSIAVTAALMKAVNFAALKHSEQRRLDKKQTPYVNHVIGVAFILTDEALVFDTDVIISAVLHDTVEDTDTSLEEIERVFGPKVRGIVAQVTDDKSLPKHVRKELQISKAPASCYEAKLVKLADKLYNLRDLEREVPFGWTPERVTDYFSWAQKVVEGLKGTNAALEAKLAALFSKVLSKDTKYHF